MAFISWSTKWLDSGRREGWQPSSPFAREWDMPSCSRSCGRDCGCPECPSCTARSPLQGTLEMPVLPMWMPLLCSGHFQNRHRKQNISSQPPLHLKLGTWSRLHCLHLPTRDFDSEALGKFHFAGKGSSRAGAQGSQDQVLASVVVSVLQAVVGAVRPVAGVPGVFSSRGFGALSLEA